MSHRGYMERLAARRGMAALRRSAVLGLVAGWAMVIVGTWRCLFVVGASPARWEALVWAGAALIALTIICPSILILPERAWRALAGRLGGFALSVLLTAVYAVLVVPSGLAMRLLGRDEGFRRGGAVPKAGGAIPHWEPRSKAVGPKGGGLKGRGAILQSIMVMAYFVRRRRFLLVPALLALLLLGMAFFFVSSSALAPLIYTLF